LGAWKNILTKPGIGSSLFRVFALMGRRIILKKNNTAEKIKGKAILKNAH